MLKEFREFIMRGNVLDLAVAVIIAAAFGAIITSLVNDIIMPLVGQLTGKVDFANLYINLSDKSYASYKAAKDAGAAVIGYGQFINTIITFLVVAFSIFLIIRLANRINRQKAAEAAAPEMQECPYCLSSVPAMASRSLYCTSDLSATASS